MSIILKVERYGAASKLFHMRGLAHAIGEDARGVLVCHNPTKPLFSVIAHADTYLIQAQVANIFCGTKQLKSAELTQIEQGVKYQLDDYRFSFYFTSALAEMATSMPLDQLEQHTDNGKPFGTLSVTSSLASRDFPLYPGLCYTLGSSPENTIVIQSDKIEPRHCSFTLSNDNILCKALQGNFIRDGVSYSNSKEFALPVVISIAAGLVVVEITPTWHDTSNCA